MKQKLHILCRCFIARCYAVRIPCVSCDGKRMQYSVEMRMKMIGMPKIEMERVRKKSKETENALNFVISRASPEFSCIESKWNFRSNEHSRLFLFLSLDSNNKWRNALTKTQLTNPLNIWLNFHTLRIRERTTFLCGIQIHSVFKSFALLNILYSIMQEAAPEHRIKLCHPFTIIIELLV